MPNEMSPETLATQAQKKQLNKKPSRPKNRPKSYRLSPTQQRGEHYETLAAQYLQQHGLDILLRNIRSRFGEIDLIARSHHSLIFIEVRYRKNQQYGGAIYSIHPTKQQRIKRVAEQLLPHLSAYFFGGVQPFCRFDVIAIDKDGLQWIPNAFY
ncbi:YraN family protein [Paenalcaligenes hermetiae]|uniref:UPF0102 protein GCM10023337_14310 n=1 Tax=Paenalcaligenes hermetiae TaxID=1157987 RepID=A0ABP9M2V6_9BURK